MRAVFFFFLSIHSLSSRIHIWGTSTPAGGVIDNRGEVRHEAVPERLRPETEGVGHPEGQQADVRVVHPQTAEQ